MKSSKLLIPSTCQVFFLSGEKTGSQSSDGILQILNLNTKETIGQIIYKTKTIGFTRSVKWQNHFTP